MRPGLRGSPGFIAAVVVLLAAKGAVPTLSASSGLSRMHAPVSATKLPGGRRAQLATNSMAIPEMHISEPREARTAHLFEGPPGEPELPELPIGPPLVVSGVPLTRSLISSLLECDLSVDGEDIMSGPRIGAGGVIHANLPLLNSAQEVTLSHFAHLFFNISSVRDHLTRARATPPSYHDVFEALGYKGDVRKEVSTIELQLLEVRSRGAYGKLFRHNLGLIHQELNKHKTCTALERADMWQEGTLGLLRAIQLFDPGRKVRFSTYACWHIRAHILHAFRDKSHMLRLPQPLQDDMKQVKKATAHLTMEHDGRKPSAALVGETLDWPVSRVQRAIQGFSRSTVLALVPSRSEDTSTGSYGGVAADSIKSSAHGIGDAEMSILKEQFRNSVRKVQEGREPEHAKMLALRYGLYDGVEWSTKQIAERFQVTSQVVYKIIRQEVKYLQARHQDFTSFVQADARELAIVRRTRGVPVRTPTRV